MNAECTEIVEEQLPKLRSPIDPPFLTVVVLRSILGGDRLLHTELIVFVFLIGF